MKCETSLEEHFYGTATVGDRGQVVIPAEARKALDIHPGDKVLVIGHPGGAAAILCKINHLREVLSSFLDSLRMMESEDAGSGSQEVVAGIEESGS